MVPTLNVAPGSKLEVTVEIAQLSDAVGGVQLAVCEQTRLSAPVLTVTFPGQFIVGFSLSFTVTVNEQVEVDKLPEASSALAVTVVSPTGNMCGVLIGEAPIV